MLAGPATEVGSTKARFEGARRALVEEVERWIPASTDIQHWWRDAEEPVRLLRAWEADLECLAVRLEVASDPTVLQARPGLKPREITFTNDC